MRIGIDVSALAKRERTGVARYGVALLDALLPLAADHSFVLGCRLSRLRRARFRYAPRAANATRRWFVDVAPRLALGDLDVFHGLDARIPLRAPFPCVATLHDVGAVELDAIANSGFRKKKHDAFATLAREARRIICVSAATRDAFCQRYDVPRERFAVVHHGVDPRFRPADPATIDALRAKLGLPRAYVLFVGLLSTRKNLIPLVHAFESAAKDLRDTALVLAGGQGHGHAELDDAIARSAVHDRILRPGFIADADLPALYSGARVFVFPGLTEGFGMPMLEAMACGTPVLAHDAPVTTEVAADAAATVDARDAGAIAAALRRAATDDAWRARAVTAGHARAGSFTWEAAARATLDVYRAAAAE
ncbi:MAG: glycosyltransferase family 4 protein [Planctomycetes bacterium]|nr:glycosyltransferase family 4 protein [Planctomycetota bacterium]